VKTLWLQYIALRVAKAEQAVARFGCTDLICKRKDKKENRIGIKKIILLLL